MRSRAAAALLALAGVFLIVGATVQRWELISLVLPITAVVSLYIIIWRPSRLSATATWNLDGDNIFAGDTSECQIAIEYEGKGGGVGAIEVTFPPSVELLEGSRAFLTVLEPKGTISVRYKLRFQRRGLYKLGPIKISTMDLAGLTSVSLSIDSAEDVRVLPQVFDIDSSSHSSTRLHLASGNIDSRLLGPGMEFFSLREYTPGDDLRLINWKATARTDDLIINQYMTQRNRDVVVALCIGNMADLDLMDGAVDMAASITSHFVGQRDRVGLAVFADQSAIVPLGYGSRQFYRCMEALTEVRQSREHPPLRIAELLDRLFPHGSLIVLIADFKDQAMTNVVQDLKWQGKEMFVISPFLKPDPDDVQGRINEVRRQDRALMLRRLCKVEEWDAAASSSWAFTRGGR